MRTQGSQKTVLENLTESGNPGITLDDANILYRAG
jgi:hypothetical protein